MKYYIIKRNYFKTKPAFKKWLDEKKDLRLNAKNEVDKKLHKDIQNGFIGKLGQSIKLGSRSMEKDGKEVLIMREDISFKNYKGEVVIAPKGSRVLADRINGELFKRLHKHTQRYGERGEFRHIVKFKEVDQRNHIGCSSWVFMKSRLRLQKIIFDNLDIWIYSDSDSCIFSDEPKGINIHPWKYGFWKKEHSISALKVLRGKAYMFNSTGHSKNGKWVKQNKIICKVSGLNERGKNTLNFENFHVGHIIKDGKNAVLNVRGGKIKYRVDFTLGEKVFV